MKEIEQIIIDLDLNNFIKIIEGNGAKKIDSGIEKQYNYNFRPIYPDFLALKIVILDPSSSEISKSNALSALKTLVFDVNDLAKTENEFCKYFEHLESITGKCSLIEYYNSLEIIDVIFFKNVDFIFRDFGINPNKWARIKLLPDGKTSIAVKQILNRKIEVVNGKKIRTHEKENMLEYECITSDFNAAKQLIKVLGYYPKSYTERERIKYLYKGTKIDIDIYPHIPPFAEIEAETSEAVDLAIKELKLEGILRNTFKKIGNRRTLNHDDLYHFYGLNMENEFSLINN